MMQTCTHTAARGHVPACPVRAPCLPARLQLVSVSRNVYTDSRMGVLAEIAASTAAGGTATILGHPLDCIKVRLQAAQRPDLGTLSCGLQMLRSEGTGAFARGLGPPLANS
eukprot:2943201-Prymnesium_polylepis.1